MRVSVIKGRDLSDKNIREWSEIQTCTFDLESPFFRPEYTVALSRASEDIYVGILHGDSAVGSGYFPFQLVRPGHGRNLPMCDYQGVIAPRTLDLRAKDVVRGCGLEVWEFDHLKLPNPGYNRYVDYTVESPIIDISKGLDAYKAALGPDGKRHMAKTASVARKTQRELGNIVLVDDCQDSNVMEKMHRWRSEKYGTVTEWQQRTLEIIRTTKTPKFSGVLSALYAGNHLIAVHFGIRSQGILHWWFPAYNPKFASYAPGIQLLLAIVERSPDIGIRKIDLGMGQQDYKRRFGNAANSVACGSVDIPLLTSLSKMVNRTCVKYIRDTPELLRLARKAKRILQKSR